MMLNKTETSNVDDRHIDRRDGGIDEEPAGKHKLGKTDKERERVL
jgi:hypothetical protein